MNFFILLTSRYGKFLKVLAFFWHQTCKPELIYLWFRLGLLICKRAVQKIVCSWKRGEEIRSSVVEIRSKRVCRLWREKKGKVYSTRYSQAVTHPSTNRARRCLTSVIGREPVYSTWYGRRHGGKEFEPTYTFCLSEFGKVGYGEVTK